MSPIESYLEWFERQAPDERATIAFAVGSMLVGMTAMDYGKDPQLFATYLRDHAARGLIEEAGLALSLVGMTTFHLDGCETEAYWEAIAGNQQRVIQYARAEGKDGLATNLEKSAETLPLRAKRGQKLAADWVELRERYLSVSAIKKWIDGEMRQQSR